MAVTYFGVNKGGQVGLDVTVDSSTTSSDIELAVDDSNLAAGAVDGDYYIERALNAIREKLREHGY